MTEKDCYAQHFGLWMVQSRWLLAASSAYNAGTLSKVDMQAGDPLYTVDDTGIAYIAIQGHLTKGVSSYGGTSNVRTRRALRAAEQDRKVRGIFMDIDSPGGTVSGQQAFADEIRAIARRGQKPIVAHAEDGMHSAALWAGVQAQRVTASPMTEIGSIGTVASVADTSGAAEQQGVKVHVVSTGPLKGAFTPGTEITDEQIDYLQKRVDEMNQFFLEAVKNGRGMPIAKVRELATGEDWMAAEAKEHGLIDAVMSRDDAVTMFRRELRSRDAASRASSDARLRAAKIAELGG